MFKLEFESEDREFKLHVYVVVQFYPWFKFYFPMF